MPLDPQLRVHVPWPSLRELLPLLVARGLHPEVYLPDGAVRRVLAGEDADLPGALAAAGLRPTVHAPFADLSPGASDRDFRALTLGKMRAALQAAAPFAPAAVVFHPGFDPLRFREHPEIWLRNCIRTFSSLLPPTGLPAGTRLLVENIFEDDPATLVQLLRALPSPPFGACFDTGHFLLFSRRPLEEWIEALAPWLGEVHLHDNRGEADEHLPPGRGRFDFRRLLALLDALPGDVIGTLEMHTRDHIADAVDALESFRAR